jgi:DNA replication protein DnaC
MNPIDILLLEQLRYLKLPFLEANYAALAAEAAQKQCGLVDYLAGLVDGETQRRKELSIQRRVAAARFPVIKNLEQFDWSWPKKINRPQIQNFFRLAFLPSHTNIIIMGGVGLGKTHLCIALGYEACQAGHSVLFTTAVDIINTLTAAQINHKLKAELKRFLSPTILIID